MINNFLVCKNLRCMVATMTIQFNPQPWTKYSYEKVTV